MGDAKLTCTNISEISLFRSKFGVIKLRVADLPNIYGMSNLWHLFGCSSVAVRRQRQSLVEDLLLLSPYYAPIHPGI